MLRKQIGQMQKLLGVWSKGKNRDLADREMNLSNNKDERKLGIPDFLSQTRGVRTTYVNRRQIVLNRHFTEIISDVLATNFRQDLNALGIKITSIETKAWNKGVSVFYSLNTPYNDDTHKKLKDLVVHLRTALTQRQLTGRTPHVNFVYDKSILVERSLEDALSKINLNENEEKRVMLSESDQLYVSKNLGSQEQKLISKRFIAPSDMNNNMLGLNYPLIYDEVAVKLSQGRGESSRIVTDSSLVSEAKPLFRGPKEDMNELDPRTRLLRMQKFIISQKQKSAHMSRLRRKQEILASDAMKW